MGGCKTDVFKKTAPVGVVDSGVGGLTVARHLQRMLPGEDIVYLGDGANCPYGNRTREELETLHRKTFGFLLRQGVKAIVVACNTVSSLLDRRAADYGVPVFTIIAPAAQAVARSGARRVGLIATAFTVRSGCYERRIRALCPEIEVVSQSSPSLAALVDGGALDERAIDDEITAQVGDILRRAPVTHLILGCTHYPIVAENFHRCFPRLALIDPAEEEAAALVRALRENDGINPAASGRFSIYTTGDPSVYAPIAARLGLTPPSLVEQVRV